MKELENNFRKINFRLSQIKNEIFRITLKLN